MQNLCKMHSSCLTALAFLLVALPAAAQLSPCIQGNQPAASLLLPWFEVDLDDPQGVTTLVGLSNHADAPTLARVVLWTDLGLPTFSFDVLLPARGARSLDLRAVFEGRLPVSRLPAAAAFPSCADPLAQPDLDAAALAQLRVRHLGQADPDDGMCYGSSRPDSTAVGFATVDVLTDCSETLRFPTDSGYFEELAGFGNALSGDVFYVDPSAGAARGLELVALVADVEAFGSGTRQTFYGLGDARAPLGWRWSTRYLDGGPLQATTELLVWISPIGSNSGPRICGLSDDSPVGIALDVTARAEDGRMQETVPFTVLLDAPVTKIQVGGEILPVETPFGRLELGGMWYCGVCSPPSVPAQTWIAPLVRSEGGFSVGLQAVREDDFCR